MIGTITTIHLLLLVHCDPMYRCGLCIPLGEIDHIAHLLEAWSSVVET